MDPDRAPKKRATISGSAPSLPSPVSVSPSSSSAAGPFGLVLAILLVAASAMTAMTAPTDVDDEAAVPTTTPLDTVPFALADEEFGHDEAAEARAERIVATTSTAPPAVELTVIPDPRADVLPVAYTPPAPADTLLDLAYGPDPAHRLDLFLPADISAGDSPGTTGAAPVLVYLHAGGWIEGDKAAVPDMVMRFVERGYVVASVNYRLAPDHPFPAPVTDVKRAIRWLKAYADDTGTLAGDRIVLVGASAGGHLATFVAATTGEFTPTDLPADLLEHDSSTVGLVSFVGPTDLVELYDHEHDWARAMTSAFVGCLPCDESQLAEAGVGGHLAPGLPPAYWAYGTEDPLVDALGQGALMALQWAAEGSESWLDIVEGAGHSLDENVVNQRALETFVDLAVGRI